MPYQGHRNLLKGGVVIGHNVWSHKVADFLSSQETAWSMKKSIRKVLVAPRPCLQSVSYYRSGLRRLVGGIVHIVHSEGHRYPSLLILPWHNLDLQRLVTDVSSVWAWLAAYTRLVTESVWAWLAAYTRLVTDVSSMWAWLAAYTRLVTDVSSMWAWLAGYTRLVTDVSSMWAWLAGYTRWD